MTSKPYISEDALENMPKKALGSFFQFRSEQYDILKSKNQDKSMTEIGALIGEMWRDLDAKKKDKYTKQFEQDKEEYEVQYDKWLKKYKLDADKVKEVLKEMKPKRRTKKGKAQVDEEQEEKQMQKKEVKKVDDQKKKSKAQKQQQEEKPEKVDKAVNEKQKQAADKKKK